MSILSILFRSVRDCSRVIVKGREQSRTPLLLLLLGLSPVVAQAQSSTGIRVIEEAAIPFTKFLSKADFDKRYPGEIVTDPSKLDTGWYVIYEHESLSYYFGPMLLESTGQDYYDQLEATVGAAVEQRPSIQDYRLELSYEPQAVSSPSDPSEVTDPASLPSTPQPAPKPSIFDVIKRWFGF
ncbi:MAG: hypothetical protein ACSHX8_02885 [Opitutaceae bacterium]